jgi:nitroreductase
MKVAQAINMDTLEVIATRRSIRKFTDKKVDYQDIEKCISSAMHAPSAGNQQPWHFIVIDDREILNFIPTIHPFAKMMEEASFAVLVCADLTLEKYPNYWVLDCSAATQNFLLAAHSIGLGAVWLGVYPREERMKPISQLFNLPENVKPLSLIAICYPNEEKIYENRFNKERIHFNKW